MSLDFRKLNDIVKEFCIKEEELLNSNSIPFPSKEIGDIYRIPTLTDLGNATVVMLENQEGPFKLDPPFDGMIKDKVHNNDPRTIVVIRRLLGYSTALKIVENPKLASFYLKPLLKEAVLSLKSHVGFDPNHLNCGVYGTFKHPDRDDYIRELEDYAAFEIRLFSKTMLIEEI